MSTLTATSSPPARARAPTRRRAARTRGSSFAVNMSLSVRCPPSPGLSFVSAPASTATALAVVEPAQIGSPMLRRARRSSDPPEDSSFDLSFMHKGIELALDAAHQPTSRCRPPSGRRGARARQRSATSGATSPRCFRRSSRRRRRSWPALTVADAVLRLQLECESSIRRAASPGCARRSGRFEFVDLRPLHPWPFSHHHSPYASSVLGALAAQTDGAELVSLVTCPTIATTRRSSRGRRRRWR